MQQVKNLIKRGSQLLQSHGILSHQIDAEVLLAHALHTERYQLIVNPDLQVKEAEESSYKAMLQRRSKKEPVAYILGSKEFWGLTFMVNPSVLIPRPDSETVIELALKYVKDKNSKLKILDLGTGSGCLVISLLHELFNSTGLGIDVSPQALEVAISNAKKHYLSCRCNFLISNWFRELDVQKFDLIVANPPYIEITSTLDNDVADYEPSSALYAGVDGLDAYRRIAKSAHMHLHKGSLIVIEVGINQATKVADIFQSQKLTLIETAKDLAGIERALAFKLLS